MSSGTIEFRGMDKVLEMLDDRGKIENVQKALEKACLLVERSAKQKAPKGDGTLQNSITSKVENLEGVVFTPLEYAPYVEYGTGAFREENPASASLYWVYVPNSGGGGSTKSNKRYTKEQAEWIVARMAEDGIQAVYTNGRHPKPFMRPALDENREEIMRILAEGLVND